MRISLNIRIECLELYLRSDLSFATFKEKWKLMHGDEPHPSRKYLYILHKKFRRCGCLTDQKRDNIRPVRNSDTITDVAAYHNTNKGMSLRSFFRDESLGISKSTLRKILKEDLGLKSFKCRKFHRLNGQTNYLDRYQMCRMLIDKFSRDATFFTRVIWTDECFF